MRQLAAGAKGTRAFLAVLALGIAAGGAWGFFNPAFRGLERVRTSLVRVEPLGQDVNGDGVATAAEGRVDVDGDGRFGDAEALLFGMESYIHWGAPGDPGDDGATELMIPNSCCVVLPGTSPRQRACLLSPPALGVTCLANGSSCKTI